MKVNGENVNILSLKHNGVGIKFKVHVRPLTFDDPILSRENEVNMVFNDLSEIDALIEMLTKFKSATR